MVVYTENMSKFVDYHAKGLVTGITTYIQDTPDLPREFETLKTNYSGDRLATVLERAETQIFNLNLKKYFYYFYW